MHRLSVITFLFLMIAIPSYAQLYQAVGDNNVGIGTVGPSQKLDVNGTVKATSFTGAGTGLTGTASSLIAGTVTANANLTGEVTSSGNATTISDGVTVDNWNLGASVATTPNAGDNDTSLATTAFVNTALGSSGGGWQDGGTNIYQTTTTDNIGVGTTTPSTTLEIVKQSSRDLLMISSAATADGDYLIIKSSGNIGINTLVPPQKLYVNGTVEANNLKISTNATAGYLLTSNSVGLGTWTPPVPPTTPVEIIKQSNGKPFRISTDANANGDLLTIDSSGNVGIGTTDTATAALSVMNGNVGFGTWKPGGSLVVIGGNVGIGVTNPVQTLEVNGTGKFTKIVSPNGSVTSTGIAFGTNNSGSGSLSATTNGSIALGYAPTGSITSSGAGCLAGGSTNGTNVTCSGSGGLAWGSTGSSGGGITAGSNGGAIAMGNTASNSTITASGSGSIAMGIASAGQTLQATGTGSVAIGEDVQALNTNSMAFGNAFTNTISNTFQVGFASPPVLTVNSSNVGIGTIAPFGTLIVAAGNVGIGTLRPVGGLIVMSGNTGIGTWSPTARLQVVGTVSATTLLGDGSGISNLPTQGTGGWTDGGTNVFETTTTDVVGIGTTTPNATTLEIMKQSAVIPLKISSVATGNGDYMIVRSDGRVGIGTTSPQGVFAAVGSGAFGTAAFVGVAPATNGLNVLGNVGIGTSSATAGLSVFTGNTGLGDTTPDANLEIVTSGTAMMISSSAANDGNQFIVTSSGNVGIGTTANTSGLIVMNGNVGIGTTTPASRLTIKGTTLMQKVSVANQACTTTCGVMACYFGEDTGVIGTLLDCSDATADVCLCSK